MIHLAGLFFWGAIILVVIGISCVVKGAKQSGVSGLEIIGIPITLFGVGLMVMWLLVTASTHQWTIPKFGW